MTKPATPSKRQVENIYALSPMQEGILFHALYEEDTAVYFEQATIEVTGTLDVACFEQSWNALLQRHEALRTNFVVKNVPRPLQVVWRQRSIDFTFSDLSDLDEAGKDAAIAAYQREDLQKPFDLTRNVLIRIGLLRRRSDAHVMVMSFHHIIMDGWCQGIVQRDLVELYRALRAKRSPTLPKRAPSYREFIKWLERQDKDTALAFWSKYLEGYERSVSISPDVVKASAAEGAKAPEHLPFHLSVERTAALNARAAECGVTMNVLVQAAWGVLLCAINGTRDAVFAAIVSGRPADLEGVEDIIGLFINAVAMRIKVRDDETWAALLPRVQAEIAQTLPYQHFPLADVQATTPLKRTLLDHILVFENYPDDDAKEEPPFRMRQLDVVEQTNYDLTVQVHPGERLGFDLAYVPSAVRRSDVEAVERRLGLILDAILGSPGALIGDTIATVVADGASAAAGASSVRAVGPAPYEIAVAATFTAEPIAPYITWWCEQAGIEAKVEFAPYNQVFQQLLDPASLFFRGDQARVILARCEDWIRDAPTLTKQERLQHLTLTFGQFVAALKSQPENKITLLGVLPVSGRYARSAAEIDLLKELNQYLIQLTLRSRSIRLLDCTPLAAMYGIKDVFDHQKDKSGHMPFSDAYVAALGTTIARALHSARRAAFKVIAVDCDNTLWKGVCGEDGALGVTVEPGHLALQQFLCESSNQGFLIALCSKNNEPDVWEVFERNPGMVLRREHIVAARINWQPKSHNLASLADHLGLGIDSFVFLDDSGVECTEVMQNRPEVLTLRLPEDTARWPLLLRHLWAFDIWSLTEDDQQRSQRYLAEGQREQSRRTFTSLDHYLASLDLQISMRRARLSQVERLSQLTQRTNQFNLSTIRRTEPEIAALIEDERALCWAIEVTDRFGNYGLVGLIIARWNMPALSIDTFLLSCRVLGRGVENTLLNALRSVCAEEGATKIEALYVRTKKNAPIREFIEQTAWRCVSEDDDRVLFEIPLEELPPAPAHVRFTMVSPAGGAEAPASAVQREAGPTSQAAAESSPRSEDAGVTSSRRAWSLIEQTGGLGAFDQRWDTPPEVQWIVDQAEKSQSVHKFYYLPLLHSTGERLLALYVEPLQGPASLVQYTPPRDVTEVKLVAAWKDVLRCEAIGIHDDFFSLGGHSLKAVQLLSRVHREFGVELTLKHIFQHPTIAHLAETIDLASVSELIKIKPAPREPHYKLSNAQRRLWTLEHLQGDTSAYVMASAIEILGDLAIDALEGAFQRVIARHESLRTVFQVIDGEPRQVIHPESTFRIHRRDLRAPSTSIEARVALATQLAEQEIAAKFDLAAGPLIRASLLVIEDERSVFVLGMHHIIGDGWSYGVLLQEVAVAYRALLLGTEPELPPLPIQYKDYAAWQSALLHSEGIVRHRQYWHEALKGELPVLDLPTERPRPAVPAFRGGVVSLQLDAGLSAGLRELCKRYNITLFMAFLAAVDALLLRYTGQRDLVVGTPVAERDHPDLEGQIGLYVNTQALRISVDGAEPFSALLERAKKVVLDGFEHQSYPFDLLVEELKTPRDPSRSPVFDVMLVLQDRDASAVELSGLQTRDFAPESGAGKFDLTFNVLPLEGSIQIRLEYRADLFDASRVEQLAAQFETMLRSVCRDPEQSINAIDLLTPAEQEALVVPLFDALADQRLSATLPALFQQQVERTPHAEAIVCGRERLSYAGLAERAQEVAALLGKEFGRSAHVVVGVLLPRSITAIVAHLGILEAACVYLPLDPDYPEERLRDVVQHSRCALLLTSDSLVDRFRGLGCLTVIDAAKLTRIHMGGPEEKAQRVKAEPPALAADTACIIYTSGSTGVPKGVECHHRGLINTALDQIDVFGIDRESRILQFASPAFDAALSEVWTALIAGATLVLVRREVIEDTRAFTAYLQEHRVSVATLPPVYLRALEKHPLSTLRTLVTAGEAPDVDLARHYSRMLRYINAYGPAECSICATMHVVNPEADLSAGIPIGVPLKNTQLIVMDTALNALPNGAVGELCVAGVGVTHGYAYQPELTAERFITHPRYGRLYRTGDLGRRRQDGAFEFVGRRDEQVKIRGQRVEPEEVRRRLLEHEAVEAAAVVDRDTPHGGKELVAFVVTCAQTTAAELRRWLSASLTAAMLPSAIGFIDHVPLTPNGKVDKQALRRQEVQRAVGGEENERAMSEAEQALAAVFSEVLARPRVGLHENYFELGGDSIKAIRVVSWLRQYGLGLDVREIFAHPTIAELVGFLRSERRESDQEPAQGEVTLGPIQAWFAERIPREHRAHFNNAIMLRTDSGEAISEQALKGALKVVVRHHDALRLRWQELPDGRVLQEYGGVEIADAIAAALNVIDLRADAAWQARLAAEVEATHRRMDLEQGHLVRAALARTPEGDRLLLVVHHLALDAFSWPILLEDLASTYRLELEGCAVKPRLKTKAFGVWTEHMRQYAESAELLAHAPYWASVDEAARTVPALPHDMQSDTPGVEADSLRVIVEATQEATQKMARAARRARPLGVNGLLLTALSRAVRAQFRRTRMAVAVEGHGRDGDGGIDISRTVGWFTSLYPVVIDIGDGGDAAEHADMVGRVLAVAVARGRQYGTLRYLTPAAKKPGLCLQTDPSVSFNYLGGGGAEEEGTPLFVEAKESAGALRSPMAPRFRDIEIDAIEEDGRLFLQIAFSKTSYRVETMRALAEGMLREAERVATALLRRSGDAEQLRLYCLPFAGSDAEVFRTIFRDLPPEIHVHPVDLPGRGALADEPPLPSITAMAAAVLERIRRDGSAPYALYGHSMGALIAYEVAGLAVAGRIDAPVHIYASGMVAPWRIPPRGPLTHEETLVAAGLGRSSSEDERAKNLDLLRADFTAVQGYSRAPAPVLKVDMTVMAGDDEGISEQDLSAWREATLGTVTERRFSGGHLFILERAAEISRLVAETMSSASRAR